MSQELNFFSVLIFDDDSEREVFIEASVGESSVGKAGVTVLHLCFEFMSLRVVLSDGSI